MTFRSVPCFSNALHPQRRVWVWVRKDKVEPEKKRTVKAESIKQSANQKVRNGPGLLTYTKRRAEAEKKKPESEREKKRTVEREKAVKVEYHVRWCIVHIS